jgi:hypothetical protein
LRPHHPDILQYRFGDHRRHGIAAADIPNRFEIVEIDGVNEMRGLDRRARSQGTQRVLARRHPRSYLGERIEHVAGEFVVVAVVAPLHHDEMLPARDRAAETNRERCGLAAGVQQRHLVDRRDVLAYQLSETTFEFRRPRTEETGAAAQRIDDGFVHGCEIVAEKKRCKGGVIVDVALAVGVPQVGPFTLREAHRRIDDPIDRTHPARNVSAVARQKRDWSIAHRRCHNFPTGLSWRTGLEIE